MSTYLWINIFILIFPLLMSFEKRVSYWRRFPAVGLAALCCGLIFVIWDSFFTAAGNWAFNPLHVLPLRILHLPLEEIIFFVTVPYSMLFVLEVLNNGLKDRSFRFPGVVSLIAGVLFIAAGLVFLRQTYTCTVLFFCAACFIADLLFKRSPLGSRNFWLMILISYIPFIIFNYFLTSLPVVTYSPKAIWNIRILTIPLEDFFYSFSLITLYGFFYAVFRNRFSFKPGR
jgi:lycopene cyclase domain-containing protein